jgi:hypothetical protein
MASGKPGAVQSLSSDAISLTFAVSWVLALIASNSRQESAQTMFLISAVVLTFAILAQTFYQAAFNACLARIPALNNYILIELNEGDRRNAEKVMKVHEKGVTFSLIASGSFLVSILIAVLVNIFSNVLAISLSH